MSPAVLCLNNNRFQVIANWTQQDGTTGTGNGVKLTDDSGYFWFFDPSNVEMVVKVLDGCAITGAYWVFAAGLTNVQVNWSVTDTLTNNTSARENPQGTPFAPVQDTSTLSSSCSFPGGGITGTWTGLVTYNGQGQSPIAGPCPASEAITASVSETGTGSVTMTFPSTCYGNAKFAGLANTTTLTGQLQIQQHTCNEEGGYIDANGLSSGPFDASHIHLNTSDIGTADCDFGGNVIDLQRSQ